MWFFVKMVSHFKALSLRRQHISRPCKDMDFSKMGEAKKFDKILKFPRSGSYYRRFIEGFSWNASLLTYLMGNNSDVYMDCECESISWIKIAKKLGGIPYYFWWYRWFCHIHRHFSTRTPMCFCNMEGCGLWIETAERTWKESHPWKEFALKIWCHYL